MKTRIQERPAFQVAGIKAEKISSDQCPSIWDKLYDKASFIQLEMLGNGQSYGICYGNPDDGKINYMAAYNTTDERKAEALGLDLLSIPQAEYLIVSLIGAIPQSIHKGWEYITQDFFPKQAYRHAGTPDFELYSQGDIYSENYRMELWVPIVKI